MSTRALLLAGLLVLIAGCALDTQFALKPANLSPVAVEKPTTKLAPQAPKDVKVEFRYVCRGTRGGVMLLAVTNAGGGAIEFTPRQIGLQLSSGHRHRFMTATEFERMCEQFGASTYGIRAEDEEAASKWAFPDEDAQFVLEPGQSKEVPLPFGAQTHDQWLTLDFDPALKRPLGAKPPGKLMIGVALPEIMPPKKSWLPEWLQFGVAVTNA